MTATSPETPTSKSPALIKTCPPPPTKPRPSHRKHGSPATNRISIAAEELELFFLTSSKVSTSPENDKCRTPTSEKSKSAAVERRCPAAPRKKRSPAAGRKRRLEESEVMEVGAEELRSSFRPRGSMADSSESAKKRKKACLHLEC